MQNSLIKVEPDQKMNYHSNKADNLFNSNLK